MPIQIGEDPAPPPTFAEKLAPWLRRTLIGGCLVWICISMQNYWEDARSHTIRVTYPLLMNYERITAPQPGFDPQKADWKPVSQAFPVPDGAILFIRSGAATYAVKLLHQTNKPERADYTWLKVGSADPVVNAAAQPLPGGITLPGFTVQWTGKRDGIGFLYLDDAFIWNKTPPFTIGVPFQSGDLESFRKAVPASVHFESVPWKIEDAGGTEIITAP